MSHGAAGREVQVSEFWSATYAAMKELYQSRTRVWETFTQQQMDFMTLCGDWGNQEVQMLMSGKNPAEIFVEQARIFMEFSRKLADRSRDAIALDGLALMKDALMRDAAGEAMPYLRSPKGYWVLTPSSESTAAKDDLASGLEETTRTTKVKKAAAV